jgi:CheY-like chemotaxis protein
MAHLKVPKTYSPKRVLLVDDEPEHLDWLVDYLKQKGLETVVATSVEAAVREIGVDTFRIYFIDLNIPLGNLEAPYTGVSGTFDNYPGLHVIKLVRSQGNSGGRVMAYSAHQNEQIEAEMKRLYSRYVLKGRPRELKREIDGILQADPRLKERAGRKKPAPRGRGSSKRSSHGSAGPPSPPRSGRSSKSKRGSSPRR